VRPRLPLTLHDSEPEPDLAVVRASDVKSAARHPTTALLVVEVAADSLALDPSVKAAIYAAVGIPEYWIVDVEAKCVEVLLDPDARARSYRSRATARPGDRLQPTALPGVGVDIAALFE
jgi:Uma2 family endonuclease